MTLYPAAAGSEEESTNFESPSLGNFMKANVPLRESKKCRECGSNKECGCNKENKEGLTINLPKKKNKDIRMNKPTIKFKSREAGVQGMHWGTTGADHSGKASDTHKVARQAGFQASSQSDIPGATHGTTIYNHPSGAMLKVEPNGNWAHRSPNGVKSLGDSPKQLGDHIKQHPVAPAVESRRRL